MDPQLSRRLHVLVVDDIDDSRLDVCRQVTELGHEVTALASGAATLDWLQTRRPDVVLLDLLMPGLDGFEVSRRIRALYADEWLPVIVTSSLEGDEHFVAALASGADDYLTRPLSQTLLDAKLRHYERVLGMQTRVAGLAQRQRDILDNILDAVLTVDEQQCVAEANLAACRCFAGGTPHGLIGRTLRSVTGADLDALTRTSSPVELRRGDGQRFKAEASASQWREGGQVRTTLVLRDLSERLRSERMRDEFLATVSHELRTPLTSVLGAVTLLASGAAGPLPAAALPLAAAAQRNGERLGKLIDDVLDLTKLEGDRMPFSLRRQPLAPLVQEAMAANQGYAERADVELRCEIDGDAEVRVDPDRVLQILANLLSNAIKHSPSGQPVTVKLAATPGGAAITVTDRGPGIDPAFRERLFEKFAQAESGDSRRQGGTGLGLYITRLLVERMGGRIEVDSSRPGASFRVVFPTADDAALARPRVGHVDYDAEARDRVADWLAPVADTVGTPSLAALASTPGCVAWLVNPQSQGNVEEFCGRLRALAGSVPVLLLSDSVDAEFAARQGFRWLSAANTNATSLRRALQEALRAPIGGGRR